MHIALIQRDNIPKNDYNLKNILNYERTKKKLKEK